MGDAGDFHARLRACMVKSGQVVKEISAASGVSKRTIDNWLALVSPTMPRVDDAVAVARALGVSAEYLVTGEGPFQVPIRLENILEDLALLPPERLDDVARLIRPWADDVRAGMKREAAAG